MPSKAKAKPKKKKALKKPAQLDPKFADSWKSSGIKLSKSSGRLAKLFAPKKTLGSNSSRSIASPLVWFVDGQRFEKELETIGRWHQNVVGNQRLETLVVEVFEQVDQVARNVESEVGDAEGSGPLNFEMGQALTLMGACHSIRAMAGNCDFEDWNKIVTRILDLARVAESDVELSADVYQLLAVEMPMALAVLVPEIEDHLQVASRCCKKMASTMGEMLDHDGWLHARYLDRFGVLSASWVRCGLMARKLDLDFEGDTASQLEWLVRQTVRCLRPDGSLTFSNSCTNQNCEASSKRKSSLLNPSLIYSLGKLSPDKADKRVLKKYLGQDDPSGKKLAPSSNISEWGNGLLLRSDWSCGSPMIGLNFDSHGSPRESSLGMEISRFVTLIKGSTMPTVMINGVKESLRDPFEVICEQSDGDVEYAELESETHNGVEIQRQILLSRAEEFLLIADVVRPPMAATINYRCRYPLAEGIIGMRETENREVYLRTKEIQSLVLPLALSEWKGPGQDGLEFESRTKGAGDEREASEGTRTEDALCYSLSGNGFGLYAPLFFDLNPKRSRKKRTWRQLTVAENREPVPTDVACAYRIQLDEQQWCFYRAIGSTGNRTFLGENFADEFVFNCFDQDGKVKPLIVI